MSESLRENLSEELERDLRVGLSESLRENLVGGVRGDEGPAGLEVERREVRNI